METVVTCVAYIPLESAGCVRFLVAFKLGRTFHINLVKIVQCVRIAKHLNVYMHMHIIGALFGWMIIMIIALLADVLACVLACAVAQCEGLLFGAHASVLLFMGKCGRCAFLCACCCVIPVQCSAFALGRRADMPNTSRRVRAMHACSHAVPPPFPPCSKVRGSCVRQKRDTRGHNKHKSVRLVLSVFGRTSRVRTQILCVQLIINPQKKPYHATCPQFCATPYVAPYDSDLHMAG